MPLVECTNYEETYIKKFGKAYSDVNKPKDWGNYKCLSPIDGNNITSSEVQRQSMD